MSFATFVGALMDVSVSGVTRVHDEPPASVSTVDLPISYPRLPEQTNEVISLGFMEGLPTMRCEVVFLIEPLMQNTNAANFAAMVALIDSINTAFAASRIGIDSWEIRQETATLGDTPYWALIASVEAS
jgi:hypothetical protein